MTTPALHRLPAPLEAAAERIKRAVRQAVERSVEGLGLAALSASSAQQRSDLLAAQFELDRRSAMFLLAFDESFGERLRKEAGAVAAPESAATPSSWSELSLVDDHEVEIKVAAERFGLQVAHSCEWELRDLNGYLAAVLESRTHDPARNPLRPEVIGLATLRAAEKICDREEPRRLLVAECCRSLANTLAATYRDIVAEWRALGLQPASLSVRHSEGRSDSRTDSRASDLPGGRRSGSDGDDSGRAPQGTGPGGFAASGSNSQAGAWSAGSSAGGLAAAGAVRVSGPFGGTMAPGVRTGHGPSLGQVEPRMMSVIRQLAGAGSAGYAEMPGAAPGAGADTLATALAGDDWGAGAMQGADMVDGRALMAPNLIRAHRAELRAASRGAVDHLVIDVIGNLFDQILSDPKVPPQLARQIARLQLPVLRAALGDPSFFSSRRHPVRRFVNRVASLGAGLSDFDTPQGRQLVERVGALVHEIVEGDFEQMALYETQLAALEAFVSEAARQSLVDDQGDTALLLQRQEDELRLQQIYAQQLQADLQSVQAPAFLSEFVSAVWSRVLVRAAALPAERASTTLPRLRKAGLELLMSVQPKASAAARKEFLNALPQLIASLNEGLDLISWPDDQRRAFFADLFPAHAEALKTVTARPLEYNLLAKQVEAMIERPMPSPEALATSPLPDVPPQPAQDRLSALAEPEARRVGLLAEASVDWRAPVDIDIDLGAEPELRPADIRIAGLAEAPDAPEPTRGKSLAEHLQIGFAYRMHLQGQWRTVRLAHVSTARSFYVFTYGDKNRQTVSLTHRMLLRLCEGDRLRAFENAYLIERATARARQQLAALLPGGPRASA